MIPLGDDIDWSHTARVLQGLKDQFNRVLQAKWNHAVEADMHLGSPSWFPRVIKVNVQEDNGMVMWEPYIEFWFHRPGDARKFHYFLDISDSDHGIVQLTTDLTRCAQKRTRAWLAVLEESMA